MKKFLLVYPPFCTPASPPYSLANMSSFLKKNLKEFEVSVIDLNVLFHNLRFAEYGKYFRSFQDKLSDYDKISAKYALETKEVYSRNNRSVVNGKKPELFDELVKRITEINPDFVAFSLVFSSQAFYASALIDELKKLGIKTVVGGPCVSSKIKSDYSFNDQFELLDFLSKQKIEADNDYPLSFEDFNFKNYFVPEPVIPIKTASSCYYKQCSFCTHHKNVLYFEYDLRKFENFLKTSSVKKIFIIDDMIPKKRALEIGRITKKFGVSWMCQLKPTDEYDQKTLKTLHESGLKILMWGVESGSDRILKLMRKLTNVKDIEQVLINSHGAGIRNIVYMMFGFPSETKEEFLHTIDFLKRNEKFIDLVSTSVFGLQEGTDIFRNPENYGISEINCEKRTVLEPKVTYKVSSGLSQEEAKKLRESFKDTLLRINKVPKQMNFFREHMLCLQ